MSLHPPVSPPIEQQGTFTTPDGLTLARRSVLPEAAARARLAIVHGYGEHCGRYDPFMRFCARHGIAAHAFDFRGHGLSPGRRGFVHRWDEYLTDLTAFLDHTDLADRAESPPLFLLAHSHGGLVTVTAARDHGLPGVCGIILANPYLKSRVPVPWHKRAVAQVADRLAPWLLIPAGLKLEWLTSDPDLQLQSLRDPLVHRCATPRWFHTMQSAQRHALGAAARFCHPLLLLIGDADPIADPTAAQQFFDQAGSSDKTILHYRGFVHELLRESHRQRVFDDILAWVEHRLE